MFGIWIGKAIIMFLRLTKKSGTSLPGKVALRFNSRLIAKLGRQLTTCIVVTGTNGKTTTANLLGDILLKDGPTIQNRAGSNMRQGIASTLLLHSSWLGRLNTRRALFEVDEASLPLLAKELPIHVAVLTNVFRDQLDRYGELDLTLNKLVEGIQQTECSVIANADDPLSLHVAQASGRPYACYGFEEIRDSQSEDMALTNHPAGEANEEDPFPRDGQFCLACGNRLTYRRYVYGQLGDYLCEECGFERPIPEYGGRFAHGTLVVNKDSTASEYPLPVRGLFNAYNALAAIGCALHLNFEPRTIAEGLLSFRPPLGRMQAFLTKPAAVLNLIKNPTGADNVLRAVLSEEGRKVVCLVINDNAADGRDVSWLWDTHFGWIAENPSVSFVVASGSRAEDMALCMKYSGMDVDRLTFSPNVSEGIAHAFAVAREEEDSTLYVLSTYTALVPSAQCLKGFEEISDNDHEAARHRASVS